MELKHPLDTGFFIVSHILGVSVFVVVITGLAGSPKVENELAQASPLFKKYLLTFICVYEYFACIYVYVPHVFLIPLETREGIDFLKLRIRDTCELATMWVLGA